MVTTNPLSFQDLIQRLQSFWSDQGCAILQPYDLPMGAGTFNPATFLKSIGPSAWSAAYVQTCRRPSDGRYGENPNRLQQYFQFQVVLKPPPEDIQALYLRSLEALGISMTSNDIRFVEDNWESPTLGAWGLGWEVWQNGMEISQFTYFQQVGGLPCKPVTGEITYGLERLAMQSQQVNNVYDLIWCYQSDQPLTYGDLYLKNEQQMSQYNFEYADIDTLRQHFLDAELACKQLVEDEVIIPAYEMVITASHAFNLLDARHAVSVTERQQMILRIRHLANLVAHLAHNECSSDLNQKRASL